MRSAVGRRNNTADINTLCNKGCVKIKRIKQFIDTFHMQCHKFCELYSYAKIMETGKNPFKFYFTITILYEEY